MKVRVSVIALFLFLFSSILAQDSVIVRNCNYNLQQARSTSTITLQSSYAKTGIYAGLAWRSNLYNGFQMNMSLASKVRHLGLNKFTPLASIGLGYDLFRKNYTVDLVPGIKGQLISSRLTKSSSVNNLELLFGYEFIFGKRFQLIQGAYYGFGHEDSENFNVNYTSFLIHIGFGYVFMHSR